MAHANKRMTTVRTAVARLASTSLTPTLASTAVSPANSADSRAQVNQLMVETRPQRAGSVSNGMVQTVAYAAGSLSLDEVEANQLLLIAPVQPAAGQRDLGTARRRIETMRPLPLAIGGGRRLHKHQVAALGQHHQLAVREDQRAAAVALFLPRDLFRRQIDAAEIGAAL